MVTLMNRHAGGARVAENNPDPAAISTAVGTIPAYCDVISAHSVHSPALCRVAQNGM